MNKPEKQEAPSEGGAQATRLTRRGVLAGIALSASGLVVARGYRSPETVTFLGAEALSEFDRFGDPAPLAEVVEAWRRLPALPVPKWTEIGGEWQYARGSQSEGLQATAAQFPGGASPMSLPHRVLEPDTPLWYKTQTRLEGPCVIRVSADDGAHLFVDGKRIPARDRVFPISTQLAKQTELIVRVLNKAVYGGLMLVQRCEADDYARWAQLSALRERLDRAVAKLRRLSKPGRAEIQIAKSAIDNPSEAKVAELERALERFPLVTLGPLVHQHAAGKAVIAWETDSRTAPRMMYRLPGGKPLRAEVDSDGFFHRATLAGLPPDTVVSYQAQMTGTEVEVQRFRTLPQRSDFSFTVWADSHIGYSRFRQNVGAMLLEDAAFTVGVGDLVVDASLKRPWEEFFELGGPLFGSTPTFFLGGNHDYDDCFEDLNSAFYNRYARLDAKPYYAWTVANCRFVALDPNIQFPTGINAGSDQHRWLLQELESPECQAAKWRFVFIHQPPYGRGWTDYAGDLPIRELLDSLIPKYKIDFVVSGHIHDYERLTRSYDGHECTFLVVGGAGGGLEDGPNNPVPKMEIVVARHHYGRFTVHDGRVLFEAFHTDTTLLDRYERKK